MRTLILKSLNACNLRCAYCSLGDKSQERTMTETRMLEALCFFAAQAQAEGERRVQVIFHGGEPMLLPASQYSRCIAAVIERFPELEFRFSMQTNGTLLTPEYLELFQHWDIHIGVSLDGGAELHDSQRKDIRGGETYTRILAHIQTMQEHEIPVALLMVVTKPALESSLDFLKDFDAMGLPLKINPLLELGEAPLHPELALEPGDYGRFLVRVFEYASRAGLKLRLSPLAELLTAILSKETPRGCIYQPNCCRNFLCIDQMGTLYPCGRFADCQTNELGSIDTGITAQGAAVLDALEARRTTAVPPDCRGCRYLDICHAGCSADRSVSINGPLPCAACEDQKVILHYLKTEGLELVKQQLLAERDRLRTVLREREACHGI